MNANSENLEIRKLQEREFHNQRERLRIDDQQGHDSYYTNRRLYAITGKSHKYLADWLAASCPGSRALDYCCGTGEVSRQMARLGADVTGIDISDISVESAKEMARAEGLADRCRFLVGDAEATGFPSASFDLIVATGVLHHVDLDAAYAEMARLLVPGGKVICVEALAHNPFIMRYRRKTPHLRTPFEVDHILRVKDIERARAYFSRVETRFFHLAAIAAIPFEGTLVFKPMLAVLDFLDEFLLRVPVVRRQAWQAVFSLEVPRNPPTDSVRA